MTGVWWDLLPWAVRADCSAEAAFELKPEKWRGRSLVPPRGGGRQKRGQKPPGLWVGATSVCLGAYRAGRGLGRAASLTELM